MPNWFSPSPKSPQHHEAQEMILLTLVRAEENGRAVTGSALARELDLARTDLEDQLKSLTDEGLVQFSANMPSLTSAGRARALSLLRRHRLAERLLTDVLGLDWARAHEEADRFEHAMSPQSEQQLAAQLGNPETCPHGNPIPTAASEKLASATIPLAECTSGARATIARIAQETPASLQHLATLGLLPDVEIELENKAPLDGPVMVRVGHAHYALGRDLAARIWVTLLPATR